MIHRIFALLVVLCSFAAADTFYNCPEGGGGGVEQEIVVFFRRADVDGNGTINITDAIVLADFLTNGGSFPPSCGDVSDANSDGSVDISDPVFILNYLFDGGPAPDSEDVCCVQAVE